MRILQIMAGAKQGGAETAFVDMCLALNSHNDTQKIEQYIITRKNDLRVSQLEHAGIKVQTLPLGGALDIYSPYKIKQIIQDFKPHIVQTWMARAAWNVPNIKDKTHVNVARLGGYYDLKYFKTSDYFVAITPLIKEYLVGQGVDAGRVKQINNFAETEIVTAKIDRADLNTPEDAFVCLALSRYHDAKALDVLIKAAADLPRVHVWLAGEGPLRGELETLAEDLNIKDRIHFLGWRSDRAALLQAADLCVFPSRHEPFGTVFVQAWAQQIPVICSLADGPRQYVRAHEDGLLFPIDDVAALKESILSLMNDEDWCARLVAAGYQRYQEEFTAPVAVDNYLTFYEDILRRESIAL